MNLFVLRLFEYYIVEASYEENWSYINRSLPDILQFCEKNPLNNG